MTEENNAKKDFDDTIKFMLTELKKHTAEPEYILLPDNTKIKNTKKEIRKYIKSMKKDMAKGWEIPRKVLFGKEKNIRKYDKVKEARKDE